MTTIFNFFKSVPVINVEPNVEGIKGKIKTLTDDLKGIKVNGEDLFTYLNNYVLLVTLFVIIKKSNESLLAPANGGQDGVSQFQAYPTKLYEYLEDVKDINHPPPYISKEESFQTGDYVSDNVIIDIINNHIDKYNTLVPLIKNNKIGFRNIIKGKIKGFLNRLETLIKECDKHNELSQTMGDLEQYKYGFDYINKDEDFGIKQRIEYDVPVLKKTHVPIISSKINDIVRFYILNKDKANVSVAIGMEVYLAKIIIDKYQNILGIQLSPNISVAQPLLKKDVKYYDSDDHFIILNENIENLKDNQKIIIQTYQQHFKNHNERAYLNKHKILINRYCDFYSAIDKQSKILKDDSTDDDDYKQLIENYKSKHNHYLEEQKKVGLMIDNNYETSTRMDEDIPDKLKELYNKEKIRILNDKFHTSEYSKHPYVSKSLVELYELTKKVLGGNSEQIKTAKKEILGKERCIYKKEGDRKEYVKHKGSFITVKDYKKLMK